MPISADLGAHSNSLLVDVAIGQAGLMADDEHDDERSADAGDEGVEATSPGVVLRGAMGTFPPFGFPGFGSSTRRCSFCSRREAAVNRLVQARGVYICDRCVTLAATAIEDAGSADRVVRIRPRTRLNIDRDEAEEAIELAYETVFSGSGTDRDRSAAIESGEDLLPVMAEVQQRFPTRDQIDVALNAVRFLDDKEAEVSFSLILPGQGHPGMPMPQGYAVVQGGTWKVARETYAATVGRIGVQVPPLST